MLSSFLLFAALRPVQTFPQMTKLKKDLSKEVKWKTWRMFFFVVIIAWKDAVTLCTSSSSSPRLPRRSLCVKRLRHVGPGIRGVSGGGVEVGGAASQPPATLWIRVDPFFSPWPSFVYGVSALFKWWHRGCRDWLLMELLLISTVTSVQLHCCAEVFVLGLNGRVDGCSAVCGVESFLKWKVFRYLGELWLKSSFQRWTTSSFTPVQRPLNFRLWPPWVTKKETYSEGKIKLLFNLVNLLLNVATMHDTKSWEICTLSKTSQTHSDENCISSVFNVLVAFFDDRRHIKKN